MRQAVITLLFLVGPFGIIATAYDSESQLGAMPAKDIGDALRAESPRDASSAFHCIFDNAKAQTLQQLRTSEHPSIALRAAWEEVRRTLPEREQAIAVSPNVEKLTWFTGFSEGRLGIAPPEWWNNGVLSARAYRRDRVRFRAGLDDL